MLIVSDELNEDCPTILEFQGEFENFDLFDGKFNSESLVMDFKHFSLQGRLTNKEFTILETTEDGIKQLGVRKETIVFDQPPIFKLSKDKVIEKGS